MSDYYRNISIEQALSSILADIDRDLEKNRAKLDDLIKEYDKKTSIIGAIQRQQLKMSEEREQLEENQKELALRKSRMLNDALRPVIKPDTISSKNQNIYD